MKLEYYIQEENNLTLVKPPEIATQIIHVNATPGFLNDADRVNIIMGMCEIADRKTTNKTIIETHFGIKPN